MTRTKRAYNRMEKCRSRRMRDAYHPYQWRCMGHCHRCRDPTIAPTRRRTYQHLAAIETDEEVAATEPGADALEPHEIQPA